MGHDDVDGDAGLVLERAADRDRRRLFELFEACDADNADMLIQKRFINVDAVDAERPRARHPDTLLSIALRAPDCRLLDVLLMRSPNLKSMNPQRAGAAVLAEAIRHAASRPMLLKAWRLCQDGDAQDANGFSPLGRAIERGDIVAVHFLVERGVDPQAPAYQEMGPLELAEKLLGISSDIATFLSVQEHLISIAAHHRLTAEEFDAEMMQALAEGRVDDAKELLEQGAVIRWGDIGRARTPAAFEANDAAEESSDVLRDALDEGRMEVARIFLLDSCMTRRELFLAALKAKCDEDVFDLAVGGYLESSTMGPDGSTLFHESIIRRSKPAIRALLRARADPAQRDRWGRSAKDMATQALDEDMASLFEDDASASNQTSVKVEEASTEIFGAKCIATAAKRSASVDAEKRKSCDLIVELMRANGGRRTSRLAPAPDMVLGLAEDFPLFTEIIEDVAARAAMSRKAHQVSGNALPFKMPNVLLLGRPGIGKTRFASELARVIGAPFETIDMGSTSSSFTVAGLDSGYANSKPGRIFNTLANGTCSNPLILLDEIDKMSRSGSYPVSGTLYPLLERSTASRFTDEFFAAAFDASHINFMASANEESAIDDAILSRFSVYHIPEADQEQAARMAMSVYREVLAINHASWFDAELDDEVLLHLASMSPRQATTALGDALSRACVRNRTGLKMEDFKAPKAAKRPIGF